MWTKSYPWDIKAIHATKCEYPMVYPTWIPEKPAEYAYLYVSIEVILDKYERTTLNNLWVTGFWSCELSIQRGFPILVFVKATLQPKIWLTAESRIENFNNNITYSI